MFNFEILADIRQKNHMRLKDFAELLRVSKPYLSQLENGKRKPSMEFLDRLVEATSIPIETWLSSPSAKEGIATNAAHTKNKLDRKHLELQQANERIWELDIINSHLMAENSLRKRFMEDIILAKIPKGTKIEKRNELAVTAMTEGELSFEEIAGILGMGRADLSKILSANKRPYKCQIIGGHIMASSPGEAGLGLHCPECIDFDQGKCVGHGNQNPQNIVEMLKSLEFSGIYNATDQANFLEKHYDLSLSDEEIRQIRYKAKNKLPIPDEVFYMDVKRKLR